MTRRTALTLFGAAAARAKPIHTVQARKTAKEPWTEFPTRTLDQLTGFRPQSATRLGAFGGDLGHRLAGPGFFRAKADGGRWWLVDPEGLACIQPSIAAVRPGESKRSRTALVEKYGNREKWAESAQAMSTDLRFTATGAWSENVVLNAAADRLPWYTTLSFMGSFGKSRKLTVRQPGHVGFVQDCMPVFHPDFEPYCDEYARRLAESKTDRYLVGHFSDNELPNPTDSLDRFLNLDASTESLRPSRDAAAAWFQRRKGKSANASDITAEDREVFRQDVYDRYLDVTNTAIRRYDPNHLCLGPRLWGKSIQDAGSAGRAAGTWT